MKKVLSLAIVLLFTFTVAMNVCAAPVLISDGGFEDGIGAWIPEDAQANVVDTEKHSGDHSLHVFNRNNNWGLAGIEITQYFIDNGPGMYNFSAFMKMASGTDNAMIRLLLIVDGNFNWYNIPYQAEIGTDWTDVGAVGDDWYNFVTEAGAQEVTWSGNLTVAKLIINTVNGNEDFYLDDVAVWKVGTEETTAETTTAGTTIATTNAITTASNTSAVSTTAVNVKTGDVPNDIAIASLLFTSAIIALVFVKKQYLKKSR